MTQARSDWDEELHFRNDAIQGSRRLRLALLRALMPKPVPVKRQAPVYIECPKIAAIQDRVCRAYRISKQQMLSKCRRRRFVVPRHIAMYLARQTGASLPRIARQFRRDHSTVLHAIRLVESDWGNLVDTGGKSFLTLRNSLFSDKEQSVKPQAESMAA